MDDVDNASWTALDEPSQSLHVQHDDGDDKHELNALWNALRSKDEIIDDLKVQLAAAIRAKQDVEVMMRDSDLSGTHYGDGDVINR